MKIEEFREILNDVGYIQHEFNNLLETYYLGLGVTICIKQEQGDIYVDFYFGGSNLYSSYKLYDLTKLIILTEVNKFIKNDKIKVLYRDSLIEEIIN
jgi:Mor family transcriptional regulator